MIFSFKKLKELANLNKNIQIEEVVKAINSIGFEVEEFHKFNQIEGIKFGHVLNVYKNPNADKLNVCEIEFDFGQLIIQTVAQNVKKNDYLMAFVPGSKSGNITFGPKEMKGIVSNGMLVSLNELGFDIENAPEEFKEGIFTFGKVDLSLNPLEFLDLDDYLIDIKILSNRSDANSYLIMARELAAYFRSEFNDGLVDKKNSFSSDFAVKNNLGILTALEAKNINDFEISLKDQLFLLKNNIKLIHPIVDLTNLNLLMTGMPTHAYDKEKIGSEIQTKLYSGKFEILGSKEVEFKNGLAIQDNNKNIISLAGVMGGEKTGVDFNTKNVIFEMGIFPIKEVRNTVKELKMETNSSRQASKVISYGTLIMGHLFLKQYITNFSQSINLDLNIKPIEIFFDKNYINKMAGQEITNKPKFLEVIKSLEILGFRFEKNNIIVPNYRHDIENIYDILEEVFRFYGYDNFLPLQPSINNFLVQPILNIKEKIATMGYQEVWTYSLISKNKNIFNPFNFEKNISLETFVSKEREEIRNSLSISLSEVIEHNQKRKIENISIFEIGMINEEERILGLASTQKNFFEIKQNIINLFTNVNLTFKKTTHNQMHPGVSAEIFMNDIKVGWIGKINPFLEISDCFFAEINLKLIENNNSNKILKFNEYNLQPLKSRDITFSLKKQENIDLIIQEIKSISGIFEINIKDIFIKDDERKITLNIICEENAIEELNKYN